MTATNTDTLPLKGVIALARANKKIERETMAFLQDHGLTLAQFAVLEVLFHKGELSIKQIIEKTLSTSGNMTVVVRNLERSGLIQRYQSPQDGRIFLIQLRDKGRDLIREVFPPASVQCEKKFPPFIKGRNAKVDPPVEETPGDLIVYYITS
jgi:MarR family 2-MHQ and catechol resistance regulon transcriptional repressor